MHAADVREFFERVECHDHLNRRAVGVGSCDDNGENKQVNTIHVKKTILSFISKNL